MVTTMDSDRVRLPGFGLDLTHLSQLKDRFPTALLNNYYEATLLTVREYTMMDIMARITDKTDRERKVSDDAIVMKWKTEILDVPGRDVSEAMIDWCIAEVRYKVKEYKEYGIVEGLDGVFKSDIIIPEELRVALKDAAAPLEDVPEKQKDWHPGSNGQVLDLVHPSMYPLVYGQSRILARGNVGLDDVSSYLNLSLFAVDPSV